MDCSGSAFAICLVDRGYKFMRQSGGTGKKFPHFSRGGGPRIPRSGFLLAHCMVRQRIHILRQFGCFGIISPVST